MGYVFFLLLVFKHLASRCLGRNRYLLTWLVSVIAEPKEVETGKTYFKCRLCLGFINDSVVMFEYLQQPYHAHKIP